MTEASIKGELFKLTFVHREGHGELIQLLIEDDEHWFLKTEFDEFWLDDLYDVVNMAKQARNAKKRVARLLAEVEE